MSKHSFFADIINNSEIQTEGLKMKGLIGFLYIFLIQLKKNGSMKSLKEKAWQFPKYLGFFLALILFFLGCFFLFEGIVHYDGWACTKERVIQYNAKRCHTAAIPMAIGTTFLLCSYFLFRDKQR